MHEFLMNDIDLEEHSRLQLLIRYENEAYLKGYRFIVGVDEAGRGPLAGPVVAAACLIPQGLFIPKINDSKKLSPKIRREVFERIVANPQIIYGIGVISSAQIDEINIYQATIQAMLMAISQLSIQPDYLLVDGLNLPHPTIPCLKIIKGDSLSQSIAAASIIAKETRDAMMLDYHQSWPEYGFNQHKGYGTSRHLTAIEQLGLCEIHRRSFAPCHQKHGEIPEK
jgi:ribonuclease HII